VDPSKLNGRGDPTAVKSGGPCITLLDLTTKPGSTPYIGLFEFSTNKLADFMFPRHYPVKQVHNIGLLDLTARPPSTLYIGLFDLSVDKLAYISFHDTIRSNKYTVLVCWILPRNHLVHRVMVCSILARIN
jgi:hypothetical protein